jgi:plasmid stability protein
MTMLQISNMPETLYARIKQIARTRRHSIDDEVVELLAQAVHQADDESLAAEILDDIRRQRYVYPVGVNAPDSVRLLREDRDR